MGQLWVKRSLNIVNFKRRIASIAWRASSSTFAQRVAKPRTTLFTAQRLARQQSNLCRAQLSQRCLQRCSLCHDSCSRLSSYHLGHNTARHDWLRPFHVAYGRSQGSMATSPMRALINHGSRSKLKFLQKSLPPPLPWLAHLCSLTHTLPPLSHNLCS